MSFSAGSGGGAGAYLSYESGTVYGDGGEFGCFATACVGAVSDVGLQNFANFGVYQDYEDFEGFSAVTAGGGSVPIVEIGANSGTVWSARVPTTGRGVVKDRISGSVAGLTFGVGLAPAQVTIAACMTEVIDDGEPLSNFRKIGKSLRELARGDFSSIAETEGSGGSAGIIEMARTAPAPDLSKYPPGGRQPISPPPPPPEPAPTQFKAITIRLLSVETGGALDASRSPGAAEFIPVYVEATDGAPFSSMWQIEPAPDKTMRLKNRATGQLLYVANGRVGMNEPEFVRGGDLWRAFRPEGGYHIQHIDTGRDLIVRDGLPGLEPRVYPGDPRFAASVWRVEPAKDVQGSAIGCDWAIGDWVIREDSIQRGRIMRFSDDGTWTFPQLPKRRGSWNCQDGASGLITYRIDAYHVWVQGQKVGVVKRLQASGDRKRLIAPERGETYAERHVEAQPAPERRKELFERDPRESGNRMPGRCGEAVGRYASYPYWYVTTLRDDGSWTQHQYPGSPVIPGTWTCDDAARGAITLDYDNGKLMARVTYRPGRATDYLEVPRAGGGTDTWGSRITMNEPASRACREALEGRVPFVRGRPAKAWGVPQLDLLCEGATNDQPALCFDGLVNGSLAPRGVNVGWKGAMTACRRSQNAQTTADCVRRVFAQTPHDGSRQATGKALEGAAVSCGY